MLLKSGGCVNIRLGMKDMSELEKPGSRKFRSSSGSYPPTPTSPNSPASQSSTLIQLEHDVIGSPPIHVATKTGALNNVELLINNSANLSLTDAGGLTALHIAAAYDFTGIYNRIKYKKCCVLSA